MGYKVQYVKYSARKNPAEVTVYFLSFAKPMGLALPIFGANRYFFLIIQRGVSGSFVEGDAYSF